MVHSSKNSDLVWQFNIWSQIDETILCQKLVKSSFKDTIIEKSVIINGF